MFSLHGKKALIIGIANENSIAYGCAKALRQQGADLAITYLNEKAEPHVRPLAEGLGADIIAPLDVTRDGQFTALFDEIRAKWGRVDTCLHSVAFCPPGDLHARVVDTSREGFGQAMDISVHSFIRMVRRAEPLMPPGGTCMTVSFYGAEKVVENYNIMGPLKTRAASGLDRFDELLEDAAARAPMHQLVSIEQVGAYAAFLASAEAGNVTGGVHYIDGGYHIVG